MSIVNALFAVVEVHYSYTSYLQVLHSYNFKEIMHMLKNITGLKITQIARGIQIAILKF